MCEINKDTAKNSTAAYSVSLGLVLGSISLITVIMNILVLYAVKTERKLHTVGNLYIVSLSVADLIVGAAVMPLNIAYLLEDKWVLGGPACLFWLSMDYVACTASIFSLFILCIDRYRSIQQPLNYLKYRTKTRASVMISGAWLISFLWIIPILGWRSFASGGNWQKKENGTCETDFSKVTWFKVLTAIANFYVPSLLMLWFYAKIYKAVQKHHQHRELITGSCRSFSENRSIHHKVQGKQKICHSNSSKDIPSGLLKQSSADPCCNANLHFPQCKSMEEKLQPVSFDNCPNTLITEDDSKVVKLSCFPLAQTQSGTDKVGIKYVSVKKGPCSRAPELSDTSDEHTFVEGISCKNDSYPTLEPCSTSEDTTNKGLGYLKSTWLRLRTQSIQGVHLNREKKAAKQLGFIMAAFMLCWSPYFVLFMVIAYCESCCNWDFYMFTIWLGYVNSTLNPFIYPLCNENFKKTFKKIFHIHS